VLAGIEGAKELIQSVMANLEAQRRERDAAPRG